ncbi:hypothetical protein BCV71DRAFT_170083 [Rhizopus microsporus]|uniref:Uncharacterized protein n=1 Tax=Rhizopus microsporus TaxID=58291 RepID=A0A1X0SGM3_RHIZD|nr:hypothetical protein BCV71DRAFT_170083 [Rhizopus microsporus]
MIDLLYKRSLVDKVFVSPCSSAKHAFQKRNLAANDILAELVNVDGNTQVLSKKNETICVVVLDYTGFTTNI